MLVFPSENIHFHKLPSIINMINWALFCNWELQFLSQFRSNADVPTIDFPMPKIVFTDGLEVAVPNYKM